MHNRAVPFLLETQREAFVVHGTPQAWTTIAAARPTGPESVWSAIWASLDAQPHLRPAAREAERDASRWLCVHDGDAIVLFATLRAVAPSPGSDDAYRRAAEPWRELVPELSANPWHGRLAVGAPADYRAPARWRWRFTWITIASMPLGAFALWLLVFSGGGADSGGI